MSKVISDRSFFASLRDLNAILKEIVYSTKKLELENASIGSVWPEEMDVPGSYQFIIQCL